MIAVIGLGYVGLPLACALAGYCKVLGFDRDPQKIAKILDRIDYTNDIGDEKLALILANGDFRVTSNPADLQDCEVFIIAVPTPINETNEPDLSFQIGRAHV